MSLEEIQGAILEKVNSLSDPFTGCIAHVFDASALKYYIVASDNVVSLYELDRNILAFNDSSNNINELSGLINTKFSELTSRVDSVNSELGNRINEVNSNLENSINTKANQATTYNKDEVNNLLNAKANEANTYTKVETYNKAEVNNLLNSKANQAHTYNKNEIDTRVNSRATWEHSYPRAETYTKAEVNNLVNAKANQANTYTKAEVDDRVNTKANWNAVVTLTGNETIFGDKAFISPVIVPDGTVSNHAVNLSQLNDKANANSVVNLWDNQTINGVKTFSSPVIVPNAIHHHQAVNLGQLNAKADINYVKKRGGFVIVNGGYFNLDNGINFQLNLSRANMIGVSAAERNIGQTGEIFIPNGNFISGFASPFNFRVAQSGFGANEVFSYLVVSANLVRITRS